MSIRECRFSGYPVVEHGSRPMDPQKLYRLTISAPRYWQTGWLQPGTPSKLAWAVDVLIGYDDLWSAFELGGEGIRDYCDFKNCPIPSPSESPTYHDFVTLAGIVRQYQGLP